MVELNVHEPVMLILNLLSTSKGRQLIGSILAEI